MDSPPVTLAQWRGLVEKELAGKSFDKTLVHEVLAGIAVAPLYVDAPALDRAARLVREEPFRICMRHEAGAAAEALLADVTDGADALWIPLDAARPGILQRDELAGTTFVFESREVPSAELVARASTELASSASRSRSNESTPVPRARFVLGVDPLAWRVEGLVPFASLRSDLDALGRLAFAMRDRAIGGAAAVVSTLPYHDAGADAADELAIALSTGASYLDAMLGAGLAPDEAADALALRIAVGRDTFVELCKLRALRVCWEKVLVASGASGASSDARTLVHAVCSSPALTVRDPWVNMLRVTTQVFAAVTGGADLVTPNAFDEAFGSASPLGRRIARNTGLVLREESFLGKVSDPAGGSYYFDTLTDALARAAWARFQDIERDGGIATALESGRLAARLDAAWEARLDRIAKRRYPILGVSEFANLDETLPRVAPVVDVPSRANRVLEAHHDAAPFEALRLRAEAIAPRPEALLVPLGPFAESRPRVGFTAGLLAAGGIRSREGSAGEGGVVACLCGTDERYAAEAAERARELKAAGASRVLVAGRPGALEVPLREAGVDGFVYVGCDARAVLEALLKAFLDASKEAS